MPRKRRPNPNAAQICRERTQANTKLLCAAPGCTKHRRSLSQYCVAHSKQVRFHGSTKARKIRQKFYRKETEMAAEWLQQFKNHEAIKLATAYVEKLLKNAELGYRHGFNKRKLLMPVGGDVMRRLQRQGVTAHEILAAVLGVHRFMWKHNMNNNTPQEIQMAYGHAVADLLETQRVAVQNPNSVNAKNRKPDYVTTRAADVRSIGQAVMNSMTRLLVVGALAVEKLEEERRIDAIALDKPGVKLKAVINKALEMPFEIYEDDEDVLNILEVSA